MLRDIVDDLSMFLEPTEAQQHVLVSRDSLKALLEAASLLIRVHEDFDEGYGESIDLGLMSEVDEAVVGFVRKKSDPSRRKNR